MPETTIPTQEDAFHYIVRYLREGAKSYHSGYSDYGYDLYLPNVMRAFLDDPQARPAEMRVFLEEASPAFYAAAWDLCRRGILRPGVHKLGRQSTEDGGAGGGFSVTPYGEQWLAESDKDDYVPTEPERFAQMLDSAGSRFGGGYRQRAQEAVRCYGAHAYLACCAMCGAAAESVLLATAIAKTEDETKILKQYFAAGGRVKIENLIIGTKAQHIQTEFKAYLGLLKYWRDNSAHGSAQQISDNEAYTSLAILLRLSLFVSDRWDELTLSNP